MSDDRTVILQPEKIQQKLERIAYEILENNYDENELVLVGVNIRGLFIAKKLADIITKIMKIKITVLPIAVDDENPIDVSVKVDLDENINNKVVIIVDDVANTGRTLLYAAKPFLDFLPKKIQIAVLVDRKHKKYPISADYVGLSLATTIQEHIAVEIGKNDFKSVYLI